MIEEKVRGEIEILIETTWANMAMNAIKTGRMYSAGEVVEGITTAFLERFEIREKGF